MGLIDSVNVVAFDFGNTLAFDPLPEVLAEVAPSMAAKLADPAIGADRLREQWLASNDTVDYPFISHFMQEEPIVDHALKQLGVSPITRALMSPQFLVDYRLGLREHFGSLNRQDVESMLQALRTRGKRLVVLSNDRSFATPTMFAWLGWADYFEKILVSEDFNVQKPDPALFDMLLDAVKETADEVVYIGDDPVRDIGPAKSKGLHAVLYVPPASRRRYAAWADHGARGEHEPDAVIQNWEELFRWQ